MQDEDDENNNQQEELEWSAFYDDEGRIYYYNSTSGESSWDPPENFNPPPPREDDGTEQEQQQAEDDQNNDISETPKHDLDVDAEEEDLPSNENVEQNNTNSSAADDAWVAYQDDEGREYYFNTVTEETTWDRPSTFKEPQPSAKTQSSPPDYSLSPSREASPKSPTFEEDSGLRSDDEGNKDEAMEEPKSPEEEPEETVDPVVKRIQDAETFLNQTDAILEPGVMSHVTELVTATGKPQMAIQALSESFYGQTAVCGLLGRWLADLKSQAVAAADTNERSKLFTDAADSIRDSAQDVVNRIAKEKFTKTGGDTILDLKKSEAGFLQDMMDSNRWRKLLIDLSASNKDSALLMYCLKEISKRGHHREIARRINQSDHFAVFNAMLASELTVIGKIAVTACRDSDTSISLKELLEDLRRTCTSTAYTYIYAIEVLRHLVLTAKDLSSSADNNPSSLFSRAIRKWERLNEDLQSTMVDPTSAAGSTALFRKRRLDVAVTISELHQRQRRRLQPSDSGGASRRGDEEDRRSKVEGAVLNFLRRYSLGTQVDDRLLDAMIPDALGGDPTNLVGNLLIRRPLTVKALLGYLFKPGRERVRSVVTRNKCARLIALAVLAAEQEALSEAKKVDPTLSSDSDEVGLTRMVTRGSELCESLENMVSFIVAADPKKAGPTPGEQICNLAAKCAAVAQGVAIWAREVTHGNDFVTSASYPTKAQSILSLVRVVYLQHPFIRDDALEVGFEFFKHSNSDVSYQRMGEIKEQSIRLLLFLIVRGEAPDVIGRITKLLSQPGTSGLDASLIRYFLSGLLEVAKPPFSVPFIRLLGCLLKVPACVEAAKSPYFGDESKARLGEVLQYLKESQGDKATGLTAEDSGLVRSLLSTYGD